MLSKLLRIGEGRMVKRLKGVADFVDTLSDDMEALSDAELRAKTDEFRARIADGAKLDDILPEAFAVAREAAWRVLSQKHFEVQIMGGAALHFGNIAEMKTGEGKTLTCVLPAYLNALAGKGVHVVTVNDYLAKRDSEWMGRVHRFLGLETDVILSAMSPEARKRAYDADIDMHIDETDDPAWHSLELLAEETIRQGRQGRVTAGHCCAMSAWDDAMAERVISTWGGNMDRIIGRALRRLGFYVLIGLIAIGGMKLGMLDKLAQLLKP